MVDLHEFERLKNKVSQIQRDLSKAEGALDETKKRIKEEFGCTSLGEVKKLEEELRKESDEAEKLYNDALVEFKHEWESKL